jgi:opacity protein-like surface antigen
MQFVKSVSLSSCFVLLVATSAVCQEPTTTPAAPPPQRGYVTAVTGMTFQAETAATFAAEYGENIGRNIQAYATFSYFDNLTTTGTRDDLNTLGNVLESLTGTPWNFTARDKGVAFIVGGKFLVPTHSGIRPYIGGGAGALNIKRTITSPTVGDVTNYLASEFGLTQAPLTSSEVDATKPIAEMTTGVGVVAGQVFIDVGYRYRKAFHFAETLDFSQFCVGIGMKF